MLFWDKILAMNMNFDFLQKTPVEIDKLIAERVRGIRKKEKDIPNGTEPKIRSKSWIFKAI